MSEERGGPRNDRSRSGRGASGAGSSRAGGQQRNNERGGRSGKASYGRRDDRGYGRSDRETFGERRSFDRSGGSRNSDNRRYDRPARDEDRRRDGEHRGFRSNEGRGERWSRDDRPRRNDDFRGGAPREVGRSDRFERRPSRAGGPRDGGFPERRDGRSDYGVRRDERSSGGERRWQGARADAPRGRRPYDRSAQDVDGHSNERRESKSGYRQDRRDGAPSGDRRDARFPRGSEHAERKQRGYGSGQGTRYSERGGRSDRAEAPRGRGNDLGRDRRDGARSFSPRREEERPTLTEQELRERELRFIRHEHTDPEIPDSITENDLPFAARVELKTLTKENAEYVARHLAMVALLIDSDPELAHQHAISASRKGGRIAICRETLAITAYTTGDYALALRELRTYRRISGKDDQLALMIDSERGLGRADRALELGRSADRNAMPAAQRVNVAIAMSGARLDLGQTDLALAELEVPELDDRRAFSFSPALFDAYAEVLGELGRTKEANRWRDAATRAIAALEDAEHDEHETLTIVTETLDGEPYEERLVDVPVDDSADHNEGDEPSEVDEHFDVVLPATDAETVINAEPAPASEHAAEEAQVMDDEPIVEAAAPSESSAPSEEPDADETPVTVPTDSEASTEAHGDLETEATPNESLHEMTLAFDFDFDDEETGQK